MFIPIEARVESFDESDINQYIESFQPLVDEIFVCKI